MRTCPKCKEDCAKCEEECCKEHQLSLLTDELVERLSAALSEKPIPPDPHYRGYGG